MIFKAVASALMASVLNQAKKDIIESAKASLLQQAQNRVRSQVLEHVAERYTKEVEHNVSQYIQALASANLEVGFKGKPGEAIINRAEGALRELEIYIEKQNPDGPVIKYLQKRYKEEGIRVITGRLYAGHLVNSTGQGTYEIMNKMGYASAVDKTRPWLTGEETTRGLAEMIANAASEIFELSFEEVNLSDNLATMSFVGDIEKKYSQFTSGEGFASPASNRNTKNKKSKKKKKKA